MFDVVVAVVIFAALVVLAGWLLGASERKERRRMDRHQLEDLASRDQPEYFDYIGADEPAVIEFRKLQQARDFAGLAERWKHLDKEFLRLEKDAGHEGRPLIMDYYPDYRQLLAEIHKRVRRGEPEQK